MIHPLPSPLLFTSLSHLYFRPSPCMRMRSVTPKPSWQPSRWSSVPLNECDASARKTTSLWELSVRWLHPSCWKSLTSAELSASVPISFGQVGAPTRMERRCVFSLSLSRYSDGISLIIKKYYLYISLIANHYFSVFRSGMVSGWWSV